MHRRAFNPYRRASDAGSCRSHVKSGVLTQGSQQAWLPKVAAACGGSPLLLQLSGAALAAEAVPANMLYAALTAPEHGLTALEMYAPLFCSCACASLLRIPRENYPLPYINPFAQTQTSRTGAVAREAPVTAQ